MKKEQEVFNTGAIRDAQEDKPRPDLISPFFTERLGHWLALGAKKYGDRNWERGIPFSRCIASLERHLVAYKKGDSLEDNLAAMAANVMFLMHYEALMQNGVLEFTLNDMPDYFAALEHGEPPVNE